MEGEEGVFVVCSQAEGAVCGAWRRALRTPGLFLLSGPGKNTHTHVKEVPERKDCFACFREAAN